MPLTTSAGEPARRMAIPSQADIGAYEAEVEVAATWVDFDGDGDTDISVYRPSNGRWYFYSGGYVAYGIPGDYPVPARDTNLDGDPHH